MTAPPTRTPDPLLSVIPKAGFEHRPRAACVLFGAPGLPRERRPGWGAARWWGTGAPGRGCGRGAPPFRNAGEAKGAAGAPLPAPEAAQGGRPSPLPSRAAKGHRPREAPSPAACGSENRAPTSEPPPAASGAGAPLPGL